MSQRRGDVSKRKNFEVGEQWNKYPSVFPSAEINKAFTCQPAREGHTVYAEEERDTHRDARTRTHTHTHTHTHTNTHTRQ